jgi:endonuclease YncB( thermonuclease family)
MQPAGNSSAHALALRLLAVGVLLAAYPTWADITGRVVAVTDGDTIRVLDASNTEHRIRLSGIDAPARGQPFGTKSREHLADWVAGRQVVVESDKTDRYGRLIGKVLVDETDVNLEQVKAGLAWWYRYYAKEQPRADRRRYEAAEDAAKAAGLGLWVDPDPIEPYAWRKARRAQRFATAWRTTDGAI